MFILHSRVFFTIRLLFGLNVSTISLFLTASPPSVHKDALAYGHRIFAKIQFYFERIGLLREYSYLKIKCSTSIRMNARSETYYRMNSSEVFINSYGSLYSFIRITLSVHRITLNNHLTIMVNLFDT